MTYEQIEILKVIFSFSLILDSILIALVIFLLGFALQIKLVHAVRTELRKQALYIFPLLWSSLLLSILSFSGLLTKVCTWYLVSTIISYLILVSFLLYSVYLFKRYLSEGSKKNDEQCASR